MKNSKLLLCAVAVAATAMMGVTTAPALCQTKTIKKTFHNYGGREMLLTVTDKLKGRRQIINTKLSQGAETSGDFAVDSKGKPDLVWRGTFGSIRFTAERTDAGSTPSASPQTQITLRVISAYNNKYI